MLTLAEANVIARFLNMVMAEWIVRAEGHTVKVWPAYDSSGEALHTFDTMWEVSKWLFPMIEGHT